MLLAQARNQALWEGVLGIVAAVLVASLTVHMWRAGRHMKKEIEGRLAASSLRVGRAAFWGVFGFTLLMITREGMETAMLMNALIFQMHAMDIVAGAAAGTLIAAFIAYLWSRYGHRVNLGRFFQVTAVFLLVFVVQLLIYGFHELAEANVLPNSEALHWATEPYGPDGAYGQYLTYLLVAMPLGWLGLSTLFNRNSPSRSQTA
jgi:high-affinity iron transporter